MRAASTFRLGMGLIGCVVALTVVAAPVDSRLERAKTLNDEHAFDPPATLQAWERRAARVREQILVAAGLWPLPPVASVNATIHGRIERDAYSVEKVLVESFPGFYVTGNLYRPLAPSTTPRPAVLSPHGHWPNGRFYERSEEEAQAQIDAGKEKTMAGARYPLQARCAMLARMGCVVFHYDMVGYADSKQIPHAKGFEDAEAGLRLQSAFGLQLYNSIRAFDFLASLEGVDPQRIGVTGASGGGTQTFFLAGIDTRPKAAFPAVMVSTGMQGGCVCENAHLLRVGTGNVEFAALAAPRPVSMTGANDWTIDIETKGLPELKELYRLYDAEERVAAKCFPDFEHNYNQVSREIMYGWFNEHLQLGWEETPVTEVVFEPIAPAELSVFDDEHALPSDAVDVERLRELWTEMSTAQMRSLSPSDADDFVKYQQVLRAALRAIVGSDLPATSDVDVEATAQAEVDGFRLEWRRLSRAGRRDQVPALWIEPPTWDGRVVVCVSDRGQGDFARSAGDGRLQAVAARALTRGAALLLVDVLLTGESATAASEAPRLPVDTKRHERFSGYTYGYNRTLLAERVHDVLTAVAHARANETTRAVHLIGAGEGGLWCLLATAIASDAIGAVFAERPSFHFAEIADVNDPRFFPGGLKYGDWEAFAAACAPVPLWLVGASTVPVAVDNAYRAAAAGAAETMARLSPETIEQLPQ